MNHPNDQPAGTIWPHLLDTIERDVIRDAHLGGPSCFAQL